MNGWLWVLLGAGITGLVSAVGVVLCRHRGPIVVRTVGGEELTDPPVDQPRQ